MTTDRSKSTGEATLGRDRLLTRRKLLLGAGVGLTGGAAAMLFRCGGGSDVPDDDGPPEVTTIRMPLHYGLCTAPSYVAKQFLLDEGFTKVEYPAEGRLAGINPGLLEGRLDIAFNSAAVNVVDIDAGKPLVMLAGVNVGCYELFGRDDIQGIGDLAGKRVAITETDVNGADLAFMRNILSWVGAGDDVKLIALQRQDTWTAISTGKAEAVLAIPPVTHEIRSFASPPKVLINTMLDEPWANNFCCLLTVSRDFLKKNPAATKRAVRAILKGADLCVQDPEWVAQYLQEHGFTTNKNIALKSVKMVRYGYWRNFESEDSVRFNAVQMRNSGVIKGIPEDIIKNGTDWRFINAIKQELTYFPPQDRPRSAFALDCEIETPEYGPAIVQANTLPPPGERGRWEG